MLRSAKSGQWFTPQYSSPSDLRPKVCQKSTRCAAPGWSRKKLAHGAPGPQHTYHQTFWPFARAAAALASS